MKGPNLAQVTKFAEKEAVELDLDRWIGVHWEGEENTEYLGRENCFCKSMEKRDD